MRLRRHLLLGAEVALATLTVVVIVSFERLFTDTSFLRETLVLALGSHVVAAVCRRANLSMLWSTPISGIALALLATAVFYPDQSLLILPTADTLAAAGDDLREAWTVFGEDAAPVAPLTGFVLTASALLWYGVFLADWAAFRLRSPLESVAPATAVFVFTALMGVDRHQLVHGTLFAAGLLGVFLTQRAERQAREEVWIAGGAAAGVGATLRVGAVAGLAAVVAAAAVSPGLPGARAEPLVDITNLDQGPETRSVLSPLVEVSTSLVNQSDTELFTVSVDPSRQDYWRMMALTTFENQIWRRSSNFDEARGPVRSDIDPDVPTTLVTQQITITGLGNIYLPAAYEVSEILDDGGVGLEYEVATGALVVERGLDQIPRGLTYTIDSRVPDYSPADLPADATEGLDGGFVAEHTQLPPICEPGQSSLEQDCWPADITAQAEAITAGATTDHERVLALQRFFLDPARFTYDLDVALDHDIDSMTEFLEEGRGYCEQFASTFAAMARSLGIPARVAVGFTWGEWDDDRQRFVVSGKHAHAWPEVHFAGVGWVVFDPTPGRSRGFDGDITGLDRPQQEGDEPIDEPPSPTTTDAPTEDPNDAAEIAPPRNSTTTRPPTLGGAPGDDDTDATQGGTSPLVVLAIVLLGLAGVGSIVPFTQVVRRRRRARRAAADPRGLGEIAWDEAVGALRLVGVEGAPHQTPHEFASRAERSPRDTGPIRRLADALTALRYSDGEDAVAHARAAQDLAAAVVGRCRAQAGTARVIGEAMDPRGLFAPPPAPMSHPRREAGDEPSPEFVV
jgi:transglutaminase-like putative cysteine protease